MIFTTVEKMLFKKKFYDKEIKCLHCKKLIKPIIKKNQLKNNFYGMRYSRREKRYLLFCPNCKKIIGEK